MPYICQRRSDIPAGVFQLYDLKPNTSQRNYVLDPPGQTKYVRRPENDTVVTAAPGAIITVGELKGVGAWLIDSIEDTPNGDALTAAQANTISAAIIAAMESGAAMTVAAVNALIAATVAGSGIGVGSSDGTLDQLLEILAGGSYVLPAGSTVDDDGSTYTTGQAGALDPDVYRPTYDTGALKISAGVGQLSKFAASTFEYLGTAGAAVVVYNDDGTVLV
jgi:hypothetical protein